MSERYPVPRIIRTSDGVRAISAIDSAVQQAAEVQRECRNRVDVVVVQIR